MVTNKNKSHKQLNYQYLFHLSIDKSFLFKNTQIEPGNQYQNSTNYISTFKII